MRLILDDGSAPAKSELSLIRYNLPALSYIILLRVTLFRTCSSRILPSTSSSSSINRPLPMLL